MPNSLNGSTNSKWWLYLVVLAVGFIGGSLLIGFLKDNSREILESEYQQVTENVAQLEIDIQKEKELQETIKESWADERELLLTKVERLSEAKFSVHGEEINVKVDYTKDNKIEIPYEDEESPPIAYALFYKDGNVKAKTYDHSFTVKQIVSKDGEGNYVVLAKASIQLDDSMVEEKSWLDKEYDLDIVGGKIVIDPDQQYGYTKLNLEFEPAITLNINTLFDDKIYFAPGIGFSFFAYTNKRGRLLAFPEIQFATTSLTDYNFLFCPVAINIGNFIPIIRNTYIKPMVGLHKKNLAYGVGIGLNF